MLKSVQYLRGLAAILVVIYHCFYTVEFMRPFQGPVLWARAGVDIFFVISGYVMVVSTSSKKPTPWQFMLDRLVRIVPLYWLATLLMLASVPKGDFAFIIGSFLFVPTIHPATGLYEPLLQQGWTLNFEMFFYAIFAATLLLRPASRFWLCASLFGAMLLIADWSRTTGVIKFYAQPIIVEFLFGMAIAKFRPQLHWTFLPFGFACLMLSDYWNFDRAIELGIPAALIVAAAISAEDKFRDSQFMLRLGDASYALYLFHFFAFGIVLMLQRAIPYPDWLFPFLAVGLAVGLSLLINSKFERPLQKLLKKQSRRWHRIGSAYRAV